MNIYIGWNPITKALQAALAFSPSSNSLLCIIPHTMKIYELYLSRFRWVPLNVNLTEQHKMVKEIKITLSAETQNSSISTHFICKAYWSFTFMRDEHKQNDILLKPHKVDPNYHCQQMHCPLVYYLASTVNQFLLAIFYIIHLTK